MSGLSHVGAAVRKVRAMFAGIHPLIVEDCRLRLGDSYEVDALAGTMDAMVPEIQRRAPDVLCLDLLHVPSLTLVSRIKRSCPACHILAVTGLRNGADNEKAFAAGVSGVLHRANVSAEVEPALTAVLSGRRFVSTAFGLVAANAKNRRRDRATDLIPNQHFLVRLVEKRCPIPTIASVLGLSVDAVNQALSHIRKRAKARKSCRVVVRIKAGDARPPEPLPSATAEGFEESLVAVSVQQEGT